MIRILIADDHTLVREGLKQIFVDTPDIVTCDEAGNGEEVLKKVAKRSYDIILLDISLPGRSGLDVLKQLKVVKPKLPVLMLSIHPEELYAVRAIRAGASGYLTKESASEELIKAIRKIVGGGKYITNSLAERIAVEIDAGTGKALHETLSDREYQVLCLIASGKTTGEIARMLSLSVKTISTHRDRILRKMQMSNNAQLIRYALKQNLVE
jgi:two-component system invasion response regulator UvrY